MLELVKLDESHTDFVLDLNNDEVFKKSFPRTSPITKEGHLSFLKKLNTTNDLYYIIKYDNKDIGTVSIYDITETVAEWGRFINNYVAVRRVV